MSQDPAPDDAESVLPFSELAPLAPARGAVAAERMPWTALLWNLAMSALPVVLIGLLALVSWWMVSNAPRQDEAVPAAEASSAPDFRMQNFSMQQFDAEGRQQAILRGRELLHYPSKREVEIEEVKLDGSDPAGLAYDAEARQAQADDANTRVVLRGDARVRRLDPAAPAEFLSDEVTVYTQTHKVASDALVEMRQGPYQVQARGLRYDHSSGQVALLSAVKGRMANVAPGSAPTP